MKTIIFAGTAYRVHFHKPQKFHSNFVPLSRRAALWWAMATGIQAHSRHNLLCAQFAHDDFPAIVQYSYFTSLITARPFMFSSLELTGWIPFTVIFQLLIAIRWWCVSFNQFLWRYWEIWLRFDQIKGILSTVEPIFMHERSKNWWRTRSG